MRKCLLLSFIISSLFIKTMAQNYDESKVPSYTLPDVLTTANGKTIKNSADWEQTRRPELLQLFANNIYGQMPTTFDSIRFTITNDDANAMDGKAHLKQVTIAVWNNNKQVAIHLVLFTPNNRPKPAPAFLLINNREDSTMDPTRKVQSEFWPAEMVIDSGYAIAAFQVNDAAPDDKDNYQNGVLQLYPEQLQADNGMKAIGAWAWAARRVMDYFEKDKDIDATKVTLVGHSRGGKTALWAGANDRRFAIVISNCSGNTGAALSRRKFGETIKKINEVFPYWFNNNYKKYNDNEAALPVDQHELLALIAPRPLYVTSATEDLWADPKGMYLALQNAQPAYELYNKRAALPAEPPAANMPIIHSVLGYHQRAGIHDLTKYDWSNFIQFANEHFAAK